MAETINVTNTVGLPTNISSMKGPSDILQLGSDDLYTLLKCAHDEMDGVERIIARAEEALAHAEQDKQLIAALNNKNPNKKYSDFGQPSVNNFSLSPVGMASLVAGIVTSIILSSFGVPVMIIGISIGISLSIYGFIRINRDVKTRKRDLEEQVNRSLKEADDICNEAQRTIDNAQAARLIPSDYRYTLALSTMMKFLENGRASSWTALADKYELQLHQWSLEKNSEEALEYQRFIALKSDETSASAKTAALTSTISAVVNIARIFK